MASVDFPLPDGPMRSVEEPRLMPPPNIWSSAGSSLVDPLPVEASIMFAGH